MRRRWSKTEVALLGCSLPFIPLLWCAVPLVFLGVLWMRANDLPRRGRE